VPTEKHKAQAPAMTISLAKMVTKSYPSDWMKQPIGPEAEGDGLGA